MTVPIGARVRILPSEGGAYSHGARAGTIVRVESARSFFERHRASLDQPLRGGDPVEAALAEWPGDAEVLFPIVLIDPCAEFPVGIECPMAEFMFEVVHGADHSGAN